MGVPKYFFCLLWIFFLLLWEFLSTLLNISLLHCVKGICFRISLLRGIGSLLGGRAKRGPPARAGREKFFWKVFAFLRLFPSGRPWAGLFWGKRRIFQIFVFGFSFFQNSAEKTFWEMLQLLKRRNSLNLILPLQL